MNKLLICILSFAFFVDARQFKHPGISNSQAELDQIKILANAPTNSVIKQGYLRMLKSDLSKLTYKPSPHDTVLVASGSVVPKGERDLNTGSSVAYAHALRWVVTGQQQYANKAIEILNAWTIIKEIKISSGKLKLQDELEAAWYGPKWLAAAEIIRHYNKGAAGWSTTDIKKFTETFVAVFKRKALSWAGQPFAPNQGISVSLHRMALGVFTDDSTLYLSGLNHFVNDILNNNPAWQQAILPSGEIWEINRGTGGDCAHASLNIEGIFNIAELAWNQGDNIYDDKIENDTLPRLLKGAEYFAEMLIAGPVKTTEEGLISCSGKRTLTYEISYNHYTFRSKKNYSMPFSKQFLEKEGRPSMGSMGKFLPWDTFTHGELNNGFTAIQPTVRSIPANHPFKQLKNSIHFSFDKTYGTRAIVEIYNLRGNRIQSLPLNHQGKVKWNLLSKSGKKVNEGTYIYSLKNSGIRTTQTNGLLFIQ